MSKIVITEAQVRHALHAQGKRTFTGRRFRKMAAQLKTEKIGKRITHRWSEIKGKMTPERRAQRDENVRLALDEMAQSEKMMGQTIV